jgi:hypothetical protein
LFILDEIDNNSNNNITPLRNPLLYLNRRTNDRIVSYKIGNDVVWTHTIDDIPQSPYRKDSLDEFKMMIENGEYEPDENTFCTWNGSEFVFSNKKKFWS